MNLHPDRDSLLRRYLLDDVTAEERRQMEDWLLGDAEESGNGARPEDESDSVDRLLLVEEELIDDYARDALSLRERELFEQTLLLTSERQQKLIIARELVRYSAARSEVERQSMVQPAEEINKVPTNNLTTDLKPAGAQRRERPTSEGWRVLFLPGWKIAVYALVVLGLGGSVWWFQHRESEVDKGMVVFNKAYRQQRPLEARLTGLSYAPFSTTLGSERDRTDYRSRELAEKIFLEAVERKEDAAAYHALGRSYLAKKQFKEAIEQFEAALQKLPDDASLHNDLGAALFERGKLERVGEPSGKSEVTLGESLRHLNRALTLNPVLLEARFNRALLYQTLHLAQLAQEDWEAYLKQDVGSSWAEEARRNRRLLEEQQKKKAHNREQLLQKFSQAWQTKDDEKAWQAMRGSFLRTGNQVIENLIDAFLQLAQSAQPAEAQERLLALSYTGAIVQRKTGEPWAAALAQFYQAATPQQLRALQEARRLSKTAYRLYNQSDSDQALAAYAQALAIFEQNGADGEALLAKCWTGACYYIQNDVPQSIQAYAQAAQESAAKGYLWLQAVALNGLALAYSKEADYSTAIRYCQQSRQWAEKLTDDNGELRSLVMLSGLYRAVGRYEESLLTVQEGLALAERIAADASQVSGLYFDAAWDFSALKLYEAALVCQQETIRLAQQTNNPLALSRYYIHLGILHGKLGDHDSAVANVQCGLDYGRQLQATGSGRSIVNYALLNLGHLQLLAGELPAAITTFNQVIEQSRGQSAALVLYWAYKGRLLTYIKQQNVTAAQAELQQVLAWIEQQREKILEESNRASFFDAEQDVYDIAIDFALSAEHDPRQAFDYAELCRARSLLDAAGGRRQIVAARFAPELELPDAVQPAPLAEIQRRMPEQVQLVEYALLEDKLVIWLITKQDLEPRVVSIAAQRLEQLVTDYVEQLSVPPPTAQSGPPPVAAELYELLIQPIECLLDGRKLLCIVPDKALHRLPFGALLARASNKYLLETYTLLYASSANLFLRATEAAQVKAGAKTERLLSVGNPRFDPQRFPELADVPSAARAAKEIAEYYPGNHVLFEQQASKAAVIRELARADVAHLEVHHLPDRKFPLRSKLVLAMAAGQAAEQESVLAAHELYQLHLARLKLVILAACQTRVGAYYSGEGIISFSRPFEAAGVLLVASLWQVDSPATTELMIRFHQNRKRDGLTTAAALRAAQIQMLANREGGYGHPYYWASFIVIGGWSEF